MPSIAEGGCLCGAIRYQVATPLKDCGYCHCRMCQRASGAPVLVFATAKLSDFELIKGEPMKRRSSDHGERWHCSACGSPLAMRVDEEPEDIDIAVVSLDDPASCPPGFHIWEKSRLAWFNTDDELRRYARSRHGETKLETAERHVREGEARRPTLG